MFETIELIKSKLRNRLGYTMILARDNEIAK